MAAYVIIDLTIHDMPKMEKYEQGAVALLAQYGARPISRDQKPEHYEGNWYPRFVVILEFPNQEVIRTFYNSPEYQPLKKMRQEAARSNGIVVVNGLN